MIHTNPKSKWLHYISWTETDCNRRKLLGTETWRQDCILTHNGTFIICRGVPLSKAALVMRIKQATITALDVGRWWHWFILSQFNTQLKITNHMEKKWRQLKNVNTRGKCGRLLTQQPPMSKCGLSYFGGGGGESPPFAQYAVIIPTPARHTAPEHKGSFDRSWQALKHSVAVEIAILHSEPTTTNDFHFLTNVVSANSQLLLYWWRSGNCHSEMAAKSCVRFLLRQDF